jgi:hypothetical protein
MTMMLISLIERYPSYSSEIAAFYIVAAVGLILIAAILAAILGLRSPGLREDARTLVTVMSPLVYAALLVVANLWILPIFSG